MSRLEFTTNEERDWIIRLRDSEGVVVSSWKASSLERALAFVENLRRCLDEAEVILPDWATREGRMR